jgi:hypothetical protein
MILQKEEVERRLNSSNNLRPPQRPRIDTPSEYLPATVLPTRNPNRLQGDLNRIPDSVRDLIAITSATSEESQSSIAESFNISTPTISNLRRGLVGSKKNERVQGIIDIAEEKKRERREKIVEKHDEIHELALDNLFTTLTSLKTAIEPECRPDKLANIASKISSVIKNTEKREEEADEAYKPRIILFAPSVKQENYYESIEA